MQVIILAAGKGTRMKMDLPKVLAPLKGKTLIEHAVENVLQSGVTQKPVVVVGYKHEQVRDILDKYSISMVHQVEQMGTGHAVMVCEEAINANEDVLVLGGDHPLINPEMIKKLCEQHQSDQAIMTFATYNVDDFESYNGVFKMFGRVIRDQQGKIQKIIDIRDASPEELSIKEVNPAYYVFKSDWLFKELRELRTDNAQQEYYLSDIVQKAMESPHPVGTVKGKDLSEAIGINTQEHLAIAEKLLHNKLSLTN